MYGSDNQGALPVNGDEGDEPPAATPSADPQWCPGRMDAGNSTQPTNVIYLKAGQIFPFINNVGVYKCPADPSAAEGNGAVYYKGGPGAPRVRSMSMNGYINGSKDYGGYASGYLIYRKESQLATPGAANLWLLMDENPYSINDAFLINNPSGSANPPTGDAWVDCPASYHNGAGGINFCDGHAIIRKWTDSTVLSWTQIGHPSSLPAHGNDLDWLLNQTTARE
jgi:prepilin-type processing-associated H-X9-DG protein